LKEKIDLVVLPSILEEACPMVIIEALTLGIPVVTTNIGGQSELVTNGVNGVLVEIKNSQEIAIAINNITEKEDIYRKYSEASFNSAKLFSTSVFEEKIVNIFDFDS
jgi:glycosyltransferase involved in cell wall biosynthesis